MRSPKTLSAVLAVAALSCGAAFASAATFGAEVYGAFNTHSMSDWNDVIDDSNASGSNFDNMTNGITGGLDARVWATPNWLITAGWEPIFIGTEDAGTEIKLDANTFNFSGAYFFPSAGSAKYGIGGGIGLINSSGEASSTGSPSVDLKGNGVGFHFQGLGEWTVSPGFALTASAGYRIAKIDELEGNGIVVEITPGNPIETDYSGLMLRAGLAFYLPSSK